MNLKGIGCDWLFSFRNTIFGWREGLHNLVIISVYKYIAFRCINFASRATCVLFGYITKWRKGFKN